MRHVSESTIALTVEWLITLDVNLKVLCYLVAVKKPTQLRDIVFRRSQYPSILTWLASKVRPLILGAELDVEWMKTDVDILKYAYPSFPV